ncbi:MAG: 4Fe-4S dicluster domain-containing protein [Defluviicoccus sp.]|nr:4Fe-4S dicluster domain-containing protein [Defluviicoccus sp.]MDG4607647.1 4Fe-4S dicluster domain-containing protein [Defluviicoccus sp.]
MAGATRPDDGARVLDTGALEQLIELLRADGYRVVGPQVTDGAIVLNTIAGADDLPLGVADDQEPGRYRLRQGTSQALFGYAAPAQGWKRFLFAPDETLWRAVRTEGGFRCEEEPLATGRTALLGVRPCDLRAIDILDQVFTRSGVVDPRYQARRAATLIIAVECTQTGGTCFCTSMGSGPDIADDANSGADVIFTEYTTAGAPLLLARAVSGRGAELLACVPGRRAAAADCEAAAEAVKSAARSMGRQMPADVATLVGRSLDHPHWEDVAARCLGCGNCTAVCPTCFCSTVEDSTDIAGTTAERRRRWDSCFTLDFSTLHGGLIRSSGAARYRQWLAHKLAHWWEQFGRSGCVGCGRCITWCPVGIDITAEARALAEREGCTDANH